MEPQKTSWDWNIYIAKVLAVYFGAIWLVIWIYEPKGPQAAEVGSADETNAQDVVSLTDLHESSQLAQFKEKSGDCRFYGAIDHTEGNAFIELKVCPTEDGSLTEEPYSAAAKVAFLPVPAGTHFILKQ